MILYIQEYLNIFSIPSLPQIPISYSLPFLTTSHHMVRENLEPGSCSITMSLLLVSPCVQITSELSAAKSSRRRQSLRPYRRRFQPAFQTSRRRGNNFSRHRHPPNKDAHRHFESTSIESVMLEGQEKVDEDSSGSMSGDENTGTTENRRESDKKGSASSSDTTSKVDGSLGGRFLDEALVSGGGGGENKVTSSSSGIETS